MSEYICKNCENTVNVDNLLVDSDVFTDDMFKCSNCGEYLAHEQLSPEDKERSNWIFRNYQHAPKVQKNFGIGIVIIAVIIILLILGVN